MEVVFRARQQVKERETSARETRKLRDGHFVERLLAWNKLQRPDYFTAVFMLFNIFYLIPVYKTNFYRKKSFVQKTGIGYLF
jgi:hypothetical protein